MKPPMTNAANKDTSGLSAMSLRTESGISEMEWLGSVDSSGDRCDFDSSLSSIGRGECLTELVMSITFSPVRNSVLHKIGYIAFDG